MTILMVDDQKSVLDGLLSGLDFESVDIDRVYAASSAAEAMEILRRQPVDILMTDIEMPGKNGLELVSMAKELQPDLLLILLTSHAVFSYAQDSVKLGCFADTVEGGRKWRDLGVKFIGYACDTYIFMQAAKADVDAFAK